MFRKVVRPFIISQKIVAACDRSFCADQNDLRTPDIRAEPSRAERAAHPTL